MLGSINIWNKRINISQRIGKLNIKTLISNENLAQVKLEYPTYNMVRHGKTHFGMLAQNLS